MEALAKIFADAPAERLALLVAILLIALMAAAIRAMWKRQLALDAREEKNYERMWKLVEHLILRRQIANEKNSETAGLGLARSEDRTENRPGQAAANR